jgi:hypothetical protein
MFCSGSPARGARTRAAALITVEHFKGMVLTVTGHHARERAMTTDPKQALQQWITNKGIKCPACSGTRLEARPQITIGLPIINGMLVTPEEGARLGYGSSLPGLPTVSAMCDSCGYVLHFAAVKVGSMQKP